MSPWDGTEAQTKVAIHVLETQVPCCTDYTLQASNQRNLDI